VTVSVLTALQGVAQATPFLVIETVPLPVTPALIVAGVGAKAAASLSPTAGLIVHGFVVPVQEPPDQPVIWLAPAGVETAVITIVERGVAEQGLAQGAPSLVIETLARPAVAEAEIVMQPTAGGAHAAAACATGCLDAPPPVGVPTFGRTNAVKLVGGTVTLPCGTPLGRSARCAAGRRAVEGTTPCGCWRLPNTRPMIESAAASWVARPMPADVAAVLVARPVSLAPRRTGLNADPPPALALGARAIVLMLELRAGLDPATTTATSAIAATTAIRTALPAAPGRRRFPPLRGRNAASVGCPPA